MPNSGAGRQPLYKIVKQKLRSQIWSGYYRAGALLPSETEMAKQFDCARLTVHRALRELAEEGYVERRRRAGTRVAKRNNIDIRLVIPRVDEEVFSRGHVYRYELIKRSHVKPTQEIAERLEVDPESRLIHLLCRHWADDRAFQFEDRWINPAAVPAAVDQPFRYYGPNQWLLDNAPFSEVEHEISAVGATKAQAGHLGVAPGTPLLRLMRRTTSQEHRLTCVKLLHPGDLYELASSFASPGLS